MTRRRPKDTERPDTPTSMQLPLGIDCTPDPQDLRTRPPIRREIGKPRDVAVEQILWMSDMVALTGKHRCTIHRWIHDGSFPKKDAPKQRPRGWLRSTYQRWLLGSHGDRAQRIAH